MKRLLAWLALCLAAAPAAAQAPILVHVRVDSRRVVAPLPPIWRFFGADEPNYTTEPDGGRLLLELGRLRPGRVYFRAHNLMTSGDGKPDFKWGSTNLYTEKDGRPVYDWTIVDRILDALRARGIHPYLEIGFMPAAISSAPAAVPYRRVWRAGAPDQGASGWSYPPSDYSKWAEIVYQWTRHNIARYGRAEVERWYFEVWNEPNLDFYWRGNVEQFYRLHDFAINAVRRALPTARVGGPDVAGSGGAFMDGFLRHVTTGTNAATGGIGTPTDFISFHAKGRPILVGGHVRMGIADQLRTVDEAFARIAAIPALADKPVVIGENDPEGCAACPGPANAYRNGPLYSSYTAASYARLWELARIRHIRLEGALTWAFTFTGQPWFAGYRQLATRDVDLAVLNLFRLFARLGPEQVWARSDAEIGLDAILRDGVRGAPDVGVLATRRKDGGLAILLWNYHDDDVPGPPARVHLEIDHDRRPSGRLWRIDETHANAFGAWKAMGAPRTPGAAQIAALKRASRLRPETIRRAGNGIDLRIARQGVVLIALER